MQRLTLALFVLLSLQTLAQGPTLSDKAQISVITCGPGQEAVYTAFGHSAFRVYDPELNINAAFNYGVFDFDQPNFYLNFAKGYNYYKLAIQDYERFEYTYMYYNRFVHEQVLNLTPEQNQKLFDFLYRNALPENRSYLYDYFYDNCATKLPEIITKVFGDSVVFDGAHITTNYTIRDLTDVYLKQQPWGDLGIDICLGLPMDKKMTPYEYMFIPDYVESGFNHATINGKPLVKETISIYEAEPEKQSFSLFHPWIVFGAFLVLTSLLTYFDWKRKKLSRWFDVALFFIVGLIGLLLFTLWIATDHRAAANNFNLLWAFPAHAFVVWLMFKRSKYSFAKKYFTVTGFVLIATLVLWAVLPQSLNVFLIPVVVALAMRSFAIRTLL